MRTITITAVGIPQPQGSARAFVTRSGRAIVTSDNVRLRPWRDTVTVAALEAVTAAGWQTVASPVAVKLDLYLPRPTSHYGRKGLLPSAPVTPAKKPDIDKLARGCLDSLTDAGVFRDDAQVVRLDVRKLYAAEDGPAVGAAITVTELVATIGEAWEDAA